MTRSIALVLTLLTGFSGLAYQIAWQRYLATLLGSHSEATAAVLGIFLGGLSVGYWLFGRLTLHLVTRAAQAGRPPRLLLVYGLLEAGIGVYALAFPLLFRGVFALSHALPLTSGGIGFVVDVALAALLIGPATVLMGGTIPILTQALSKTLQEATRFHALVYAFNTVGAFAGALAGGFYLVPVLGLVRVMPAECAEAFAERQSSAPFDDSSSEEWIERCSATPRLGQECERGLDGARALLEGPSPPAAPAQAASASR